MGEEEREERREREAEGKEERRKKGEEKWDYKDDYMTPIPIPIPIPIDWGGLATGTPGGGRVRASSFEGEKEIKGKKNQLEFINRDHDNSESFEPCNALLIYTPLEIRAASCSRSI